MADDVAPDAGDLNFADKLWQMADKLRGTVDAAEYKHVVLGLFFLKYISDAFEARRDQLRIDLEADGITGSGAEILAEPREEYTADRVFWVRPEARWGAIRAKAVQADISQVLDDAIFGVGRLVAVGSRVYSRVTSPRGGRHQNRTRIA